MNIEKTLTQNDLRTQPSYDPEHLLDAVSEKLNLKNDASLARRLNVAPPVISKIRHRHLAIGDSMLIKIHDATLMPINDLRQLMGVPRVPA
jgi:hypothetical protein